MDKRVIATLAGGSILFLLAADASFGATPEETCQAAKLNALRKRSYCRDGERRKEILGKPADPAKCETRFAAAIARQGGACRWLVNGDGTATDLDSGLQWELKTDDGGVHDKDNTYTWNTTIGGAAPNGTIFTDFLDALNYAESNGVGASTTSCFADKCDWRLPTLEELAGILDEPALGAPPAEPYCAIDPCTTIPGLTVSSGYWTLTSHPDQIVPGYEWAWVVIFQDAWVGATSKEGPLHARAVRGDS